MTATREQLAEAAITGRQSGDRISYTYAFDQEGRSYQGTDSSTQWHNAGDKVPVYFDPKDPEKNALRDFFGQASHDVQPIPLVLSAGYGLVVFMSMRASRKRQPTRTI